jgi:hypothetical protein
MNAKLLPPPPPSALPLPSSHSPVPRTPPRLPSARLVYPVRCLKGGQHSRYLPYLFVVDGERTNQPYYSEPGETVGLVGANGCGKSTLLRVINGARGIDAGDLRVAYRADVGYLEQTAVSGSRLSVAEVGLSLPGASWFHTGCHQLVF